MKDPPWAPDALDHALLREAEELLAKAKPPSGK